MDIDEKAPGNVSQQHVTVGTDNETGHDAKTHEAEKQRPADEDADLEEDMADVDAADSVAPEHPAN